MFSKKVIIPFLIFLGVVLIGTSISFWSRSRIGQQLDIEIRGPQQVFLGVPFDIDVSVVNKSRSILEDSRLTITLPEGAVFVGDKEEKTSDFAQLGSIGSGGVLDQSFTIMFLRGENTIRRLTASLGYSPSTIGARFEKEAEFDISVGKSALSLDIVAPQKILSGENFEITVRYENKSSIDFSNLQLKLEYPLAFNFIESTLQPDKDNNVWDLGSLRPGSDKDFLIGGELIGPDNSFFEIRGSIEAEVEGEVYTVTSTSATVSISPSPFSLKIFLNESNNFSARLNDSLNYTLSYTNNTDVALRDIIITAELVGEMFDLSSIRSRGIFRSLNNTLIWNTATNPELRLLAPNQAGSVDFSIRTLRDYPISRLGDRNFTLKVKAQVESPTVPYFLAADRTIGLTSIETKVSGLIDIESIGLFRDAVSGIINTGPFPPQADKPTQFSIHWVIKNFATDVRDVEVKTFLEGDTKFLRVVKSNTDSVPIYNARRQELVWNIDRISATRGVISEPVEAIFQIETIPSINMINTNAPLLKETTITAVDEFTGVLLQDKDSSINTRLPDDPTISEGRVLP
jgi:hypothetical protein